VADFIPPSVITRDAIGVAVAQKYMSTEDLKISEVSIIRLLGSLFDVLGIFLSVQLS
jgi:hypothetical protein